MMSGTEATEGGSTAPVSLLTGLQSLNERSSSHSRAKPPSSTPERPTLSRINKRPSGIGEEGYYLQQDLDALYDKWITEYDRNKRVEIRKSRMLDGTRGDRHRISKHHYKRLHRRRAKGKRTTRGQGEDEEFSSGDEQSYSDEDAAGNSGSLTGDSEEDDDGELYDDVREKDDSGGDGVIQGGDRVILGGDGVIQGGYGVIQRGYGVIQEGYGVIQGGYGVIQGGYGVIQGREETTHLLRVFQELQCGK
ncbi:hypothetical protein BGZ74_005484 [Mortierella antarctica]|nr:hypothetical protein BGZ74_005484 [Mortierella antarctica]